MKKLITVLALSLTATVCFAGPADSENASTVPVASVLKAQKAISILANNPSVQFQGGTVIHDLTKVDRTKPWCKMEMVNTVSNERTLKDESRLRISSLYSNYEYIQDEKKNYYYYKYVSFIFPRTDLSHIAWVTCFTATGEANGESSAVKNLTIGEVRASLDGQLELSFPDPQVIESSTSGSEAIED